MQSKVSYGHGPGTIGHFQQLAIQHDCVSQFSTVRRLHVDALVPHP